MLDLLKDVLGWLLMMVGRIVIAIEAIFNILLILAVVGLVVAFAYIFLASLIGALYDVARAKRKS